MSNELINLTACTAVSLLQKGEVTPGEMIDAAFKRIEKVDGAVNAMPTLCRDRAEEQAKTASRFSLLAGLPIGIKDLSDLKGVRSTQGSPIYKDHVPNTSALPVKRLERAGGIPIGKTNTPEFGAGANTFNPVFGITRNPWDTSKSCAGSSGGSAVALATGQVWLASGSDMGGSLRTPASFNGVVGLRPSPGLVARINASDPFSTLSVQGPMARTVEDTALMLDAMAGASPLDPLSKPAPEASFRQTCLDTPPPRKIAFSHNLGGIVPVDRDVTRVFETTVEKFEAMGIQMVEATPNFTKAVEIFNALRGLAFLGDLMWEYENHRSLLKEDVIWNIEFGKSLSADQIATALRDRATLISDAISFMAEYDAYLCPTAIVPPYPAEQLWVKTVNGVEFENYIQWLAPVSAITLTTLPALAIPAGFTKAGLPIGIQLVGKPRQEGLLLGHGRHLEEALGLACSLPIKPKSPTTAH